MGMTIEEALNLLNNSRPNSNNAFSIQMNEAINVISETMRNYQKILKILNSTIYFENGKVYSYTYDDTTRLRHIREVIEDGNDD